MKEFYNPAASSTYFREGKKLSAQNRKGDYIVGNEKACAEVGEAWFACEMHEDHTNPFDSYPKRYLPEGNEFGPYPTRDEAIAVAIAWCDKMNAERVA